MRVFYRLSPVSSACVFTGKLGIAEGFTKPLSEKEYSELMARIEKGGAEHYGHDLVVRMNSNAEEAFRSAGLGVLDLTAMMGRRIDAHPSSSVGCHHGPNRSTGVRVGSRCADSACMHFQPPDFLHFCLPGVPDAALNLILSYLYPSG